MVVSEAIQPYIVAGELLRGHRKRWEKVVYYVLYVVSKSKT
jgi:hypothetical protein